MICLCLNKRLSCHVVWYLSCRRIKHLPTAILWLKVGVDWYIHGISLFPCWRARFCCGNQTHIFLYIYIQKYFYYTKYSFCLLLKKKNPQKSKRSYWLIDQCYETTFIKIYYLIAFSYLSIEMWKFKFNNEPYL